MFCIHQECIVSSEANFFRIIRIVCFILSETAIFYTIRSLFLKRLGLSFPESNHHVFSPLGMFFELSKSNALFFQKLDFHFLNTFTSYLRNGWNDLSQKLISTNPFISIYCLSTHTYMHTYIFSKACLNGSDFLTITITFPTES